MAQGTSRRERVGGQKKRVSFRRDLLGQAHQRLWIGGDQKRRVLPAGERVWGFLIASLQVVRTSPFVSCQKNRVSFRRDLLGQAHQRLWIGGDQKRRVLPAGERVWGFLIASLQVVRTSPFVSCFGKSVCCRGSACSSVGRGRKYSPRKTEQASLSRYVFSRVPDVVSSS